MTADRAAIEHIARVFDLLADIDFKGTSPLYQRLTRQCAREPEVLALLLKAPVPDRLPHLLFAAVQYLLLAEGSDPLAAFDGEPISGFRAFCLDHRAAIEELVATRFTQTNEVGRCAALLPCLAAVAAAAHRPLALIEVGCSAGLNLGFDRYRYAYAPGAEVGPADSTVVLRPELRGDGMPALTMPEVRWRRGLDRRPIHVTREDAVRWLRACIWPEQRWRIDLLDRAVAIARRDPAVIVTGDAVDDLPALVAAAPSDAAVCVVHTATLMYFAEPARFVDGLDAIARTRPLWWVSGEAEGLIPQLTAPTEPPRDQGIAFLYGVVPLGVDGAAPRAVARAAPHGMWLEPFSGASW
jgi:hypothetical protein